MTELPFGVVMPTSLCPSAKSCLNWHREHARRQTHRHRHTHTLTSEGGDTSRGLIYKVTCRHIARYSNVLQKWTESTCHILPLASQLLIGRSRKWMCTMLGTNQRLNRRLLCFNFSTEGWRLSVPVFVLACEQWMCNRLILYPRRKSTVDIAVLGEQPKLKNMFHLNVHCFTGKWYV